MRKGLVGESRNWPLPQLLNKAHQIEGSVENVAAREHVGVLRLGCAQLVGERVDEARDARRGRAERCIRGLL